jgi:2',3'-cyclic-nucleotide 2'-phosphodiesterase (5'-nucleotidase family)
MHKLFKKYIFLILFIYPFFARSELIPVDKDTKEDIKILEIITPYKTELDKKMNDVVSQAEFPITKHSPEGLLGNLISDLFLRHALKKGHKTDISLWNNRGLRSNLPKGDITIGDVYKVCPFGNTLAIITLNGKELREFASDIIEIGGEPLAGMKIEATKTEILKLTVNGKDISNNASYKILTSDYLVQTGWLTKFTKKNNVLLTGIVDRDAFIEELKNIYTSGAKLEPKIEGRIIIKE